MRFYKDVVSHQTDNHLKTQETEGPYLGVFTKDGRVELTAIAADTITIYLDSTDAVTAILCLLAVYYVFDIDYPKPYSMALGLLQQRVLGELFLSFREVSPKGIPKMRKSQGYADIMALLDSKISESD